MKEWGINMCFLKQLIIIFIGLSSLSGAASAHAISNTPPSAAVAENSSKHFSLKYSPQRITEVSLEALKSLREQQLKVSRPVGDSGRKFTLLFTNDFHSHLEASPSNIADQKVLGGIIRIAHCFEKIRRTQSNPVLILDAGDYLQGTPYFEKFKGAAEIEFMNQAGYHIATVGNHDLDKGINHLLGLLKNSKFKTVCSNIFLEGESEPCFSPYQLFKIDNVSVAVVGIMGKDAWQSIHPAMRSGITLEDPSITLDRILPEIRPFVDVIVLLSHSGIVQDRLYAENPLIDIIVGGHSHTFMEAHETIGNTVVFQASKYGHLVGKMDVQLDENKISVNSSVEYMDDRFDYIEGQEVQESIVNLLNKCIAEMGNWYNEILGECLIPLPTENKMYGVIPLGEAICEVIRKAGEADVAVIPTGSIKCGIVQGPFTMKTVHELLAHDDTLCVAEMKGSLLLELFQVGHNRWGLPKSFQYSGIQLTIENSIIQQAFINGKEIEPDAIYKIAAPSFFFEREFEGKEFYYDIIADDLRIAFANIVRSEGMGQWVAPILNSQAL